MPKTSQQHEDIQRILVEHQGEFDFMDDLRLLGENHPVHHRLHGRNYEVDMLFESISENQLVIVELKLGDRDITDTSQGKGEKVIRQILNYRDSLRSEIADIYPDMPVKCILVAHRIAPEVRKRAEEEGIACVAISVQSIIRRVLGCRDESHTHPSFSVDEYGDYLCEDGRIWSSQHEDINLPLVHGRERPFSSSEDRNATFAYIKANPGLMRQDILAWARESDVNAGAVNVVLRAKERIKFAPMKDKDGPYTILWP